MILPRLLIVEDEVLIADDIAELCRLKGYEVLGIALDAGQALNLIHEKKPDLVLLDINLMDEVNGFEIAEKCESHFKIPYLFITSYTDDKTLDRVANLHPLSFIVKPFNKHQLLASIDLAWQRHHQKRDMQLTSKLEKLRVEMTDREYHVLHSLLEGKAVQEIGEELFLSKNTIKYHIKNIYEKLDVHSKVELFIKLK